MGTRGDCAVWPTLAAPDNTGQGVFTALRETTTPDTEETNASRAYDVVRDDYRGAGRDAHARRERTPIDLQPRL